MLGNISTGFQTSTIETYIFLGVLAAIFVALFVYQLFRKHANEKAAEERRRNPPRPILRSHSRSRRSNISLSSREQRTLDHLCWFLKDPSREDKLLEDDTILLKAARRGIREGIVNEAEVLRLLNRLEVNSEALTRDRRTSASITSGAEVSIADRELHTAAGELLLSDEAGMQVRIASMSGSIVKGTPVEVVCNSTEGLFRFHTVVLQSEGKHITLQHSRSVEHVQRRKYRRRYVDYTTEITIPGISTKPLKSRTYDISIGGASMKNPRKRLIEGTRIDCTVDTDSATPITLSGTVLRTTKRKKTVHVVFGPLDDKTRHRLFRKLVRIGAGESG